MPVAFAKVYVESNYQLSHKILPAVISTITTSQISIQFLAPIHAISISSIFSY